MWAGIDMQTWPSSPQPSLVPPLLQSHIQLKLFRTLACQSNLVANQVQDFRGNWTFCGDLPARRSDKEEDLNGHVRNDRRKEQ